VGVEARKNSATLIRNKIREMVQNKNLPVVLTGDFNLTPDQEPIILLKRFMKDSREVTEMPPYGPVGTYNNFKIDAPLENRIDYIFVYGGVKVLKYGVLTDFNNHRTPSDHLPVFAKVQFQ
jgi:endonuclease/exonuclease/phosphatase family metal-dependent hydrolase